MKRNIFAENEDENERIEEWRYRGREERRCSPGWEPQVIKKGRTELESSQKELNLPSDLFPNQAFSYKAKLLLVIDTLQAAVCMQWVIGLWIMNVYIKTDKFTVSDMRMQNNHMLQNQQLPNTKLICFYSTSGAAKNYTLKSTHTVLYLQQGQMANVTHQSLTAVSTYTFSAQLWAQGEYMSMQCTHSDTHYEHSVEDTHTKAMKTKTITQQWQQWISFNLTCFFKKMLLVVYFSAAG